MKNSDDERRAIDDETISGEENVDTVYVLYTYIYMYMVWIEREKFKYTI